MQKLEMDARALQISIPMTSQSWHVGLSFQGSVKMTFGLSLVRGCDDSSGRSRKAQGDRRPGRRAGQRQEKVTEGRKVQAGAPGEPGGPPSGAEPRELRVKHRPKGRKCLRKSRPTEA